MKQPQLSLDLSSSVDYADNISSVLKRYFRVWASQETKDRFIRSERRMAFNHIVPWSIECQNLNSEISYAFSLLEEQIVRGVTNTKKQGEVKWFTMPDVIMQYYCNDISYRIVSMWDKLGQIINVYFLNSKFQKREATLYKVGKALESTPHQELVSFLETVINSKTFKDLKSYRNDFTHSLTQELANKYKLHGKFWHTDDLIRLLIDSYLQLAETYEFIFQFISKDAASTNVTDFQEMLDRTPFFEG